MLSEVELWMLVWPEFTPGAETWADPMAEAGNVGIWAQGGTEDEPEAQGISVPVGATIETKWVSMEAGIPSPYIEGTPQIPPAPRH